MVDRSQALKFTLGLPSRADASSRANAGRWMPGANMPSSVPTAIPVHGPKCQPGLHLSQLPQPWRRHNRQRPLANGFTLVELLIAVVIIGVLSGVAMPAFLGQQNKAKINAANVQARGLVSYCLAHFIDNGKMPESGDKEYDRLSKNPNHSIIEWTVNSSNNNQPSSGNQYSDNKCEVRITGNGITLDPNGIFVVQASGDATTIQATPAKTKR
ncbi:type II secretion system protein [Candidatus Synechococcus spongiarum]|uniref:Prepilin-type N-terminal cleavage/methylation domain-containing protein n=1 Tax=Candidatus Synechococcus spongiarum TaxID=431041 RepID=A0A165B3G0_9SYNE|nr:type II secretion system protein [Candidatus Synechococcus spongiarum]SAY39376.1 hypothetical protein FLM9_1477 [Candidatus Synechococcus spongiarum]